MPLGWCPGISDALGRCAVEVGTWDLVVQRIQQRLPRDPVMCSLADAGEGGLGPIGRPIANPRSEVRTRRKYTPSAVRRTMRPSTWTQGVVKLGLGRVTAGMVMLVEDRAQSTEHRAQRTGEPAFGHSVADLLSPSPVRPYGHSAGRRVPSALRQRRHSPRQRRQHLHSTSQLRQQGRRAATAPRRSQLAPT